VMASLLISSTVAVGWRSDRQAAQLPVAPLFGSTPSPSHADKPPSVAHEEAGPEADVSRRKIGGVNGLPKKEEAKRDGRDGAEERSEIVTPTVLRIGTLVGEELGGALRWTKRGELFHGRLVTSCSYVPRTRWRLLASPNSHNSPQPDNAAFTCRRLLKGAGSRARCCS
jgi:hypothetical protein